MSKTLQFKVFCIEAYKSAHNMTGYDAVKLFKKFGVLEYLDACYDVLHTTGRDYLIDDIDRFIKVRS